MSNHPRSKYQPNSRKMIFQKHTRRRDQTNEPWFWQTKELIMSWWQLFEILDKIFAIFLPLWNTFLFISEGFLSWKVFTILSEIFNFLHNFESFQENAGLVVPWLIGILTFISFEALGLVYANVLKDQIFGVSFWVLVDDNFLVGNNENSDLTRKALQQLSCNKKFLRFLPTALRCLRQDRIDILFVSNTAKCKHIKS